MGYEDRFKIADDYIGHTNEIVKTIKDPFIQQKYIGFVTISAVTAYELAIKDILINFAERKHKVFGAYIETLYEKINGRIAIKDLRKNHVLKFGDKYLKRFDKYLKINEDYTLERYRRSIKTSYGNL